MDGELLRIGVDGVVPVQWEAEKAGGDPGTLTGWASVYNVVDQQDDVIVPGAFRKTLSDWRSSKRVIPLTLDHQNSADGVIGSLADATDSGYGLRTTFRFANTSKAQDARALARDGHLNGLSVWGPIFNKAFDVIAGKEVRVLKEVGLLFVGLTPMPANADSLVTAAKGVAKAVTDRPWDGSQSRFTIEQWRRSTLIDTEEGDADTFERYKLPVREPDGTVNRNGVHAAAGGRGLSRVEGISAEKRQAAARALVRLYREELDEDPPESLLRAAGMASSSLVLPEDWVQDMQAALSIRVPHARKVAVDELVQVRYGVDLPEPGGTPGGPGDDTEGQPAGGEPEDDAAKYALELIGEASGPDGNPPGGEPSDSLADLLAPIEAAKTYADLDQLLAEAGTDRKE